MGLLSLSVYTDKLIVLFLEEHVTFEKTGIHGKLVVLAGARVLQAWPVTKCFHM
jgi:hypothetical protein